MLYDLPATYIAKFEGCASQIPSGHLPNITSRNGSIFLHFATRQYAMAAKHQAKTAKSRALTIWLPDGKVLRLAVGQILLPRDSSIIECRWLTRIADA